MAKRIVSGIFVLTALGALGVILAGALTSGEQLIVRFLTAVTVAALGLYVISDLRMQGEESEVRKADRQPEDRLELTVPEPENSIAYMNTVTGRHRAIKAEAVVADAAGSAGARTFEPVEPVTRPRVLGANSPNVPADTHGLRPLHPKPDAPIRALPPHPNTILSRTIPSSEAPTEPFASALAEIAPLPTLVPVNDKSDTTLPGADTAEVVTETEQPEPAVETETGGTTTISYSGPLRSEDVEWPPKPEEDSSSEVRDVLSPDVAFGVTDDDGVATQDIPLDGIEAEFDLGEEEYGPVTVDELLGDLNTDLSAPLRRPAGPSGDSLENPSSDGDRNVELGSEPELSPEPIVDSTPAAGERRRPHLTLVTSEEAARQIEASHYAAPIKSELVNVTTDEPLPPSQPPTPNVGKDDEQDARLNSVIRSGEMQVISTLIQQGMLSTSGPITDRDVRTMVYVAFTSNELRKLIRSGGTPDRIRSGDIDLGPVELFDERRYAPLPQRVYDPAAGRAEIQAGPTTEQVLIGGAVAEDTKETFGPNEDESATIALDSDVDLTGGDLGRTLPPLPSPKYIYRKSGADMATDT